MANYNVDINVKVRGEELKKFQEQLRKTQKQVNGVNRFLDTFKKQSIRVNESIANLNAQLSTARNTFRDATIGTKQQVQAAKDLLQANKNLNKGLSQQQKLLDNLSGASAKKTAADNQRLQDALYKLELNQTRKLEGRFETRQRFQEEFKQEITKINEQRKKENQLLKENVLKTKQSVAAEIKKRFSIVASAKQRRRDLIISNRQVQTEIKINQILDARRRKQAAGARGRGLGNTASSAIIGGSFPLLFGQTGASAIGGGIGGAAGGLIGGQFGFALSIFGTAIGSAVDRAEKFNKSLVELNQRMGITGGATAISAKEVNSLAKSLNITKEEVFGVLGAFQEFGSGEIAKSMAMIFGGDAGGVDRFAGLDRSAKLAQEIFNARKQIGNEAAKNLLIQNQTNDAAVIELALVKAKAKAEQDAAIARVKAVSAFDQIRANTPGLLIRRLMGNMKVTDYGDIRAENLQKKFAEDNITLLENYKKGIIEARELLELLRESQGQFGVSGTLQFTAITDKVKDLQDEMKALQNPIKAVIQVSDLMATSFEDSFKGIIKGTMTVADAFRNMLNKMADYFLDTAARMMANQLQQGLLGLLGNIFLRNPYGVKPGQSLYDVPTPSRFTDMTGGARANGGPVKGGSSYLVGERGPEMFSPGVSGTITPNHALVGSTNIVVNVDATGSSVEGDEQRGRELGALISAAIQSELINEKRPGGLLGVMATFPSITPTYGVQKRSAPNTRTVRFADGYEHRLLFGLAEHQNPKIFNLTFEVSETDADTIETFLDARANDSASFDFTPPGEATSSKFVCESWNKSIPYLNRARVQVTFREVFEP